MIFYAYDLELFSGHGRGFYRPYKDYVPGPVVATTEEIIDLLHEDHFDLNRIKQFKECNYKYLDGKSAERIYQHIIQDVRTAAR